MVTAADALKVVLDIKVKPLPPAACHFKPVA